MRVSCFVPTLVTASLIFFSLTVNLFDQETITVGPNVQVSKANADREHVEVMVAADPDDPLHLLGCSIVRWGEKTNRNKVIAYASSDGGKNWQPVLDAHPDPSMSDPACAFGPNNSTYFVAQGRASAFVKAGPGGNKLLTFLYRSRDGGRTWLSPTILEALEAQFMTADDTKGKYHGRLYIHGVAGIRGIDGGYIPGLTIYRSIDDLTTLASPVELGSQGTNFVLGPGPSVVLSDGTLVISFNELRDLKGYDVYQPSEPNGWFKIVTSNNGGETFSKAVVVSDWYSRAMSTTNSIPALAADRSNGVFRDRLYAAWPDVRSGRSEILFSYSSDKGLSWSRPIVVNDDRPRPVPGQGPDDFMPTLAVNRDGVVSVMWYDRRDNADNLGWWVRLSASVDGGETFLPSIRVSEAPFNQDAGQILRLATLQSRRSDWETQIFLGRAQFMGGDYAGLVADTNGIFHPFWVDNRTGVSQVWTTSVTVNGKAIRNGSAELSGLEDITDKVLIEFTNPRYDRAKSTIFAYISLLNTSKVTFTGPIKVRVLSLSSEFGRVKTANTDNQGGNNGEILDFTPFLDGRMLKPGESSKDMPIEFRLSDVRELRPLRLTDSSTNFVTLRTRIFGNVSTAFR